MTKHGHNMLHQRMESPKDQCPLHLCTVGKLFPPDKEEDGRTRGHPFVFLSSFLYFTFLPQM
jgi:hypothetical protein